MLYFTTRLTELFERVLTFLHLVTPWRVVLFFSILTALLLLVVLKVTLRPDVIHRRKDRLVASVIEILLFRHDAVVTIASFGRVLSNNLRYLGALVPSLLCGFPVALLLTIQASSWLAYRPLRPGEDALVTVHLKEEFPVLGHEVSLERSENVAVSPLPVRDVPRNEIHWQVRATEEGRGWIEVAVNGRSARKSVVVSERLAPVSPLRTRPGVWRELFHPVETPLTGDSAIAEIRVGYPTVALQVGRWNINWILSFFVLTLLIMFILASPLRVEF